jgi:molecular chaperone DnaK (HSP70)
VVLEKEKKRSHPVFSFVQGKKMSVLVPRNTTLPAKVTEPFTTTENNQTEILFRVFEGERPLTKG